VIAKGIGPTDRPQDAADASSSGGKKSLIVKSTEGRRTATKVLRGDGFADKRRSYVETYSVDNLFTLARSRGLAGMTCVEGGQVARAECPP